MLEKRYGSAGGKCLFLKNLDADETQGDCSGVEID